MKPDRAGRRELHALVKLVHALHGRMILSGDTRQHGAVTASDALRGIETCSGLKAAEIRALRRQDPKLAKTAAKRCSAPHPATQRLSLNEPSGQYV